MGNTDETVTTMRVHLDNTPENTQTPQEIARKIRNKFQQSKQNEDRRNLQSFNNNRTTTSEQGTSTNLHSYEHNRPVNNQNRSTTESYTSPPPRTHHFSINQQISKHQRQQLWKQFGFRTKILEHLIAHTAAITIHYCHIEIGLTCHLIRESIISSCHLSTILKTVCQSTSRLCHQKIRTQLSVVQKIWGETNSTRHCILNSNNSTA